MNILIVIYVMLAIYTLIFILRNTLICRIELRAVDVIFDQPDWEKLEARLHDRHYFLKVLDCTKWTFKSFYPDLLELEKQQCSRQS